MLYWVIAPTTTLIAIPGYRIGGTYTPIVSLTLMRNGFKHKICYKPQYLFLRLKTTPTKSISTRVMVGGKFLKFYKLCKKYYTVFFLRKVVYLLNDNNIFKKQFNEYRLYRDFDMALFWRIHLVNSIFNLHAQYSYTKLKKKKQHVNIYLAHIKGISRYMFVLSALKALIYCGKKNRQNLNIQMFSPLLNFLTEVNTKHAVTSIKLKAYQTKLVSYYR